MKNAMVGISVFTIGINPKSQIPTNANNIVESHCHFDLIPSHILYEIAIKEIEFTKNAEIYGCRPSNFNGA
jgi:hypothetical protein